ncbi:MAG: methyltransferase family protein [Limisphaerales bacterium]
MNGDPSIPAARGTGWVVAQFVLMAALLAAGPWWRDQWAGWPAAVAGAALLALGAWLGVRGVRDLGPHRTPFPQPREDGELVTTGLYGHLRHPLYAAVIVLGFAWALLWRSWPALVLAVVQVPFFNAKARAEEHRLRIRFAAYEGYAARVRRFVPGLY